MKWILILAALSCNEVKAGSAPTVKVPKGLVCRSDWHTGRLARRKMTCWVTAEGMAATMVSCETLKRCVK